MSDALKLDEFRSARVINGLAGVVALLVGLTATPVRAADLGGDCCADLEERVADLEATTVRKGNRRVSLRLSGHVNQGVLFWRDAYESNAYVVSNSTTGNVIRLEGEAAIRADLKSGFHIEWEINSARSDAVDQFEDDSTIVGNRANFRVRHANWWMEHARLGRLTVGQGSQATDGIAELDLSRTGVVSTSSIETWNEAFLGRGKNANGFFFPIMAGVGSNLVAPRYLDIFRGNLDGGRADIVRYDSPTIAGFKFSASWGEDDDWDAALRYYGEWNGFRFVAGVGYHVGQIADSDNINTGGFGNGIDIGGIILFGGSSTREGYLKNKTLVGSASLLHTPTGLFLTAAAGRRQWVDDRGETVLVDFGGGVLTAVSGSTIADLYKDDTYLYLKGGVVRNWFGIGDTALYGEYYRMNFGLKTDRAFLDRLNGTNLLGPQNYNEVSEVFGAGIVQHIDAAAMEIYLSYRKYKADNLTDVFFGNSIGEFKLDTDMVFAGGRIRF